MTDSREPAARLEWGEEQLRYRILRAVHDRAGARCDAPVSLTLIGTELDLPFEDLFRVVAYLERNGYLFARASDQSICITPNGVLYIEQQAHRRQSVRAAERPPAHPRRPDLDEPRAG